MENSIKFLFSGDSALVIEFGNEISVDINKKIRKMMDNIKKENIDEGYKRLLEERMNQCGKELLRYGVILQNLKM